MLCCPLSRGQRQNKAVATSAQPSLVIAENLGRRFARLSIVALFGPAGHRASVGQPWASIALAPKPGFDDDDALFTARTNHNQGNRTPCQVFANDSQQDCNLLF
jgi:hypothetical protein